MKVYIDDIRIPKGKFDKILRSSKEAIRFFEGNGCPNFISFDHDLGADDTAMKIVKFLVEKDINSNGKFIPKDFEYNVHSANPVGKSNLLGYLKCYLKQKNLS